ncbi:hypothetical protein EDD36DRAFT_443368 [Exophiala viscosa]|uniref:DUF676 domain-containing protein n=1 Tax=Exophiala viscosa TaxID=2486360 RepID=A0AAN6DTI4_9EURO|nr:hypothetical protein EDD36DRAFT_443368 [Exophiala viscosa]
MRKTLLLVFIHGFKGGDDTFATFPEHLRALVSHALPNIDVIALTYPRFETRGDLKDCVARFKEWLQNKVIDLEVARSTPSPTIDPSIHVMLLGHSMGGIVAAETYIQRSSDQPIPSTASRQNVSTPSFPSNTTLNSTTSTSHPTPSEQNDSSHPTGFMFPHIQGILAFDTPYLGLAPGMVAHGLEGGHKVVANAYNTYTEVASIFGWGSKSEPNIASSSKSKPVAALPAPTSATADAAATPKWQSWGKYAMFAGAAGAVVAGGAAALYSQREKLTAGWQWASDHLLFVGELFKPEYLRKRVEGVEQAFKERGGGCANLYSNLGRGAREGYGITASVAGSERTFCNLPVTVTKDGKGTKAIEAGDGFKWIKTINDKAVDETTAHTSMFIPRENPGFYALGEQAKECVTAWVDQGWYHASDGPTFLGKDRGITYGEVGDEWEKPDYNTEEVKAKERERDRYGGSYAYKDENDEVRMTDEGLEDEDLEDSVIVEKAAHGEVPLPKSRSDTG